VTPQGLATVRRWLRRILRLRSTQFVTDTLVRVAANTVHGPSRVLCAPHLPSVYKSTLPNTRLNTRLSTSPKTSTNTTQQRFETRRTRRWHALDKTSVSFADALMYMLCRCTPQPVTTTTTTRSCTHQSLHPCNAASAADRPFVRGALLSYTVSTRKQHDHANMVYLDFRSAAVRCYLFEPNGPAFTRTYPDGLSRLQQAWRWVQAQAKITGMQVHLESRVRIVGSDMDPQEPERNVGLQTLLGRCSVNRYRTPSGRRTVLHTTRRGYGVCGAVSYWVFVTWLWGNTNETLEQHYRHLHRYIRTQPEDAREKLLTFIRSLNTHTFKEYAKHTREYIHNDLVALAKHSCTLSDGTVASRCERSPNIKYNVRIHNRNGRVLLNTTGSLSSYGQLS
jgi:hypothetical protein